MTSNYVTRPTDIWTAYRAAKAEADKWRAALKEAEKAR